MTFINSKSVLPPPQINVKYLKCAQSVPKSQAFPSQVCRKASKNALHSLAQGIKPFSPLLPSHCLCRALLCACLCFKTPLGSCLGSPFSPYFRIGSLVPTEAASRNCPTLPPSEIPFACTCSSNGSQSQTQVCIKCSFLNLSCCGKKECRLRIFN